MRTPLFVYRARRWWRRQNLALVLVPGTMLALIGLLALVLLAPAARAPETIAPADALVARPAAASAKITERTEAAVIAETQSVIGGNLTQLPPIEVLPPLLSIDGTSFKRGGDIIRFDGVEGPAAEDVCLDERGSRWACGLQARAALHNLVANRPLRCQPIRGVGPNEMTAECSLITKEGAEMGNIARLLVAQGWARPSSEAAASFSAQAETARDSHSGLWRGGWTLAKTEPP